MGFRSIPRGKPTQDHGWSITTTPAQVDDPESARNSAIITDSQRLLRKIEHCTLRRDWLDIISQTNITWAHCPEHSGVVSNEKTDKLAARANPLKNIIWTNKTCRSSKQLIQESTKKKPFSEAPTTPASVNHISSEEVEAKPSYAIEHELRTTNTLLILHH